MKITLTDHIVLYLFYAVMCMFMFLLCFSEFCKHMGFWHSLTVISSQTWQRDSNWHYKLVVVNSGIRSDALTTVLLEEHDMSRQVTKPTKSPVRPAKTQISLGICPFWSESSLCALFKQTAKTLIGLGGCPGSAQADLSRRWAHRSFCCLFSCCDSYIVV